MDCHGLQSRLTPDIGPNLISRVVPRALISIWNWEILPRIVQLLLYGIEEGLYVCLSRYPTCDPRSVFHLRALRSDNLTGVPLSFLMFSHFPMQSPDTRSCPMD
jgi:hypothetical protein